MALQGSVLNRSQSFPDQIWFFHKTFLPFLHCSQTLTRMRRPRGVSLDHQRKSHAIWDMKSISFIWKKMCMWEEFPEPYITGHYFLQKRQIPCKVSIAAASVRHSPKVTVDKDRWTSHQEQSNSVHFWHVTHSVVTLSIPTQSWGKCEITCSWTGMSKSMCMVLSGE